MPWTGKSFRATHNKNLSLKEAKRAARTANAILRETGDEGKAIAIANSMAEKHDPMEHGYEKLK